VKENAVPQIPTDLSHSIDAMGLHNVDADGSLELYSASKNVAKQQSNSFAQVLRGEIYGLTHVRYLPKGFD